eukprot:CAMPEP_0169460586 /NCGR_PEP_ID=MMETSP1042-20121227/18572_1 /TAXON_ID=464988 /ORGANISM="Hemiselmis andersenii, Strain CCMP1180" /LENGTH=282 /DNA_ID=CAMNT_0009573099 /DNA_START=155 /DNA_END=1003 /DNA_ORIENTATION=-
MDRRFGAWPQVPPAAATVGLNSLRQQGAAPGALPLDFNNVSRMSAAYAPSMPMDPVHAHYLQMANFPGMGLAGTAAAPGVAAAAGNAGGGGTEVPATTQKRARGRPPGSKDNKKRSRRENMSSSEVAAESARPRGRPRGSKDSVPRVRRSSGKTQQKLAGDVNAHALQLQLEANAAGTDIADAQTHVNLGFNIHGVAARPPHEQPIGEGVEAAGMSVLSSYLPANLMLRGVRACFRCPEGGGCGVPYSHVPEAPYTIQGHCILAPCHSHSDTVREAPVRIMS